MASELNRNFNLKKATESFNKHKFSRENDLRLLKIGPEPFNSRILRGAFYMTTASIPALTREALDVPFQGTNIKTVGQLQYGAGTSSIGFRTAGDFMVRNALEQWITESGVNPLTGEGKYCVSEDSTVQYVILNEAGRIVRGYEFIGVFPTNVGEIAYNMEGDQPTTFDFEFGYQYFCPMDITVLDLAQFEDDASSASDSRSTNKSLIFDDYEAIIAEKENSTDTEC